MNTARGSSSWLRTRNRNTRWLLCLTPTAVDFDITNNWLLRWRHWSLHWSAFSIRKREWGRINSCGYLAHLFICCGLAFLDGSRPRLFCFVAELLNGIVCCCYLLADRSKRGSALFVVLSAAIWGVLLLDLSILLRSAGVSPYFAMAASAKSEIPDVDFLKDFICCYKDEALWVGEVWWSGLTRFCCYYTIRRVCTSLFNCFELD